MLYNINIDGKEIKAQAGQTILEAAKANGIDIPNLCYDNRIEPYGACGLCVVEVEGINKLLRACATKVADNMIIHTNSGKVYQSRKIALELLLSDHKGDCRPPCRQACPGLTDCQGYVGLIANGYFEEALQLLKESYPLPASLGRVCPHPCEDACRRQFVEEPIAIAWLKQFVADLDLTEDNPFLPEKAPATGKKIAIVGGGPAGLTAAHFLAKYGHSVAIYEMMPAAGGMLRYGIPEYRLPKAVLDKEIALVEAMGVQIITNVKIGKDLEFNYLKENFDAVYLAIGAWKSAALGCDGEDLEGVLGGIDFLQDVALNKVVTIGKKVAVVGGGNTAMDACRTAVRLGAEEVYLLYRRTKKEMPAAAIEIEEAEEEGVIFKYLVAPIKVIGADGKVAGIELQQMKLGEPDSSGRRRPVPIEGALENIELDTVIAAIGQKVVPIPIEGLDLTRWNTIVADESTFQTSIEGVFAGGDAINNGPGIAIQAMGHARKAADVIDSYLKGQIVPYQAPYLVAKQNVSEEDFVDVPKAKRVPMAHLTPELRKTNFKEIVKGFTMDQAVAEASRCLECGCCDVYDCKLLAYAQEYNVQPAQVAGDMHSYKIHDEHPYIYRDQNKCILCGLCVRACEQIVGVSALGLHDRGFNSTVEAGFGELLLDSRCVSCGQCVAVCPTGALQERQPNLKPVPLRTEAHKNICNYCGVGCNLELHQHGTLPAKVTPEEGHELCSSGRFGYLNAFADYSMSYPLVRFDNQLNASDMDEAVLTTIKSIQSIQAVYGRDAVGFVIGDKLTTEEIFLARYLAHDVLGTEMIFSANATNGGISDVLGADGSTTSYEELSHTELIMVLGTGIYPFYPMFGLRVKKAVQNGAKLLLLNNEAGPLTPLATAKMAMGTDVGVLKQIAKALLAKNSNFRANGVEELAASLADVQVSEEAHAMADMYAKAKNVVIVFDRSRTSREAAQLIADIAVLAGHIGKARSGIIQMRARNNSQGLADMGIRKNMSDLNDKVYQKEVRALVLIGQDIPEEMAKGLEFLFVADSQVGAAMPYADVVRPQAGFGAVNGSYTSMETKIQFAEASLPSQMGEANWQILNRLVQACQGARSFNSLEEIREQIKAWYPAYKQAFNGQGAYTTFDGTMPRYKYGFENPDGKAILKAVEGDIAIHHQMNNQDIILKNWMALKKEKGLLK